MAKTRVNIRDLNSLKPVPATVADNTVIVESGIFMKSDGSNTITYAGGTSSAFPAIITPGNSRIDILAISDLGVLSITSGIEGLPGTAPTYPNSKLSIAEVTITETGTVVITAGDIKDVRPFLNLGSGGATLTVGTGILGNLTVTITATIDYLYARTSNLQYPLTGSIVGTANQINVSSNLNSMSFTATLSLPQSIHSSAAVQFNSVNIQSLTVTQTATIQNLILNNVNVSTRLTELSTTIGQKQNTLTGSIVGTTNQINVSSNVNSVSGTVTLSLPQSIATTSAPTFAGIVLSTLSLSVTATINNLVVNANANFGNITSPLIVEFTGTSYPVGRFTRYFSNPNPGIPDTGGIGAFIYARANTIIDGQGPAYYLGIQQPSAAATNVAQFAGIRSGADNSGDIVFCPLNAGAGSEPNNYKMIITKEGRVGINLPTGGTNINYPMARLHLPAGSTTVPPLKLTAGTNTTAVTAGAMEWDGARLYMSQTTGPTRQTVAYVTESSMTINSLIVGTLSVTQTATIQNLYVPGYMKGVYNFVDTDATAKMLLGMGANLYGDSNGVVVVRSDNLMNSNVGFKVGTTPTELSANSLVMGSFGACVNATINAVLRGQIELGTDTTNSVTIHGAMILGDTKGTVHYINGQIQLLDTTLTVGQTNTGICFGPSWSVSPQLYPSGSDASGLRLDGSLEIERNHELRFFPSAALSPSYVGFKSPTTITATTTLIWTLPDADGLVGQSLITNGSKILSFATVTITPGGTNWQIQYNNSGVLGGTANFVFNGLSIVEICNDVRIKPGVGGNTLIQLDGASTNGAVNVWSSGADKSTFSNDGTQTNITSAKKISINSTTDKTVDFNANTIVKVAGFGAATLSVSTTATINTLIVSAITRLVGGVTDSTVTVPIILGDTTNFALNTANKTIIGAINEVHSELPTACLTIGDLVSSSVGITVSGGTNSVLGTITIGLVDPMTFNKYYMPIPTSNSSATGIFATFTASVTMTFGQMAYMRVTGALDIASASTTLSVPVIAMCADTTVSINTVGNFLLNGIARYDSWAWTVGTPIYTSTVTATQGLTQVIPSVSGNVVQVLGIAKSATTILFNPNMATVVIV